MKLKDYPRSRAEAKLLKVSKYYTGNPCIHGHLDLRHTISASCITCDKEKAQRQRDERGDEIYALRRYRTKYDKEYRDRVRLQARNRYKKNKRKIAFQRLEAKYGVNQETYEAMLRDQNNRCAICRTDSTNSPRAKMFYIDHCHSTSKVRGLLCHKCNFAIGNFNDDINLLRSAIDYLKPKLP